jgi:branched-chain amino acid transport system substrate-binding protein
MRRFRLKTKRNFLLLMVAVLLAYPVRSTAAADPFNIYAIMPLTGPAAFVGKGAADMFAVAEATVNKSGGVNGRPIKIVLYDDQSRPDQAVQLTNQLVEKGANVILGSGYVASCNAMAALVAKGPVIYCFSPGMHPEAGSYAYSAGLDTRDAIATAVRYARERGWKKVAVLTSTDASGQDADKSVDAIFANPENASMAIVDRQHFGVSDLSLSAQMAHIRSSGAQALIAWTTGTPFGTVLRSASDAALSLPIIGGIGNLTYAQMEQYKAFLSNVYFPGPPVLGPNSLPDGEVKRSVATFLTTYGTSNDAGASKPDIGSAGGWDATMLVIGALRKLGTNATAAQIREYINAARYNGILGRYDFGTVPQRGLNADFVVILKWDAGKDTWVSVSRPGGHPL